MPKVSVSTLAIISKMDILKDRSEIIRLSKLGEDALQACLVRWCKQKNWPCFAIPNGSNKSPAQRAAMMFTGLTAGVPDLFLPVPSMDDQGDPVHGLFIELKHGKNKASKQQKDKIKELQKLGYACHIFYDLESAVACIEQHYYLKKSYEQRK